MNWFEVIADPSLQDLPYKIELNQYGAQEVWLCNETGTLEFFSPAGALETSALFPKFPSTIK